MLCAILIALGVFYTLFIIWVILQWKKNDDLNISPDFIPQTKVSIIIPVRNEEKLIKTCLQSILNCNYPEALFEIIVVDDFSDDSTRKIVRELESTQIKLIELKDFLKGKAINAHKKSSLMYGVSEATGDYILCTDGDSEVEVDWIRHHVFMHEENGYDFLTGPVVFHNEKSLLSKFQSLDMMGLMAITHAGVQSGKYVMANGANMSFTKSGFRQFNNFDEGNFASGDDMFLIESFDESPETKVGFLKSKEALVKTHVHQDWSSYLSQRKRWATKSGQYKKSLLHLILGLVSVFVWLMIIYFFFGQWYCALWMLLIKSITDYLFLKEVDRYFERNMIQAFFMSIPLHLFHIAYSSLMALFPSKYKWKGRSTK